MFCPTSDREIEVPWSTIQVRADSAHGEYLAGTAKDETRNISFRIKELRSSRHLSSTVLAARTGNTTQGLPRIEHGRHDIVFTTRQRLLAAMGYTFGDLVVAQKS